MEAIERIKTVHHLNCQDIFVERFEAATLKQLNTDFKVILFQVENFSKYKKLSILVSYLRFDQRPSSNNNRGSLHYWIFHDTR